MIARINTATLLGISSIGVEVEVHLGRGQNKVNIIGLGDSAVKEAKDRVLSALRNSGFVIRGNLLVNLSPAELRKEGSLFDLPIALGILVASRVVSPNALDGRAFVGELSLDGQLKQVRGMISLAAGMQSCGLKEIIVPLQNAQESALVSGILTTALNSLAETVAYLNNNFVPDRPIERETTVSAYSSPHTFSDVWGQEAAKRALAIAAAGGHNVLMIGPPGCGKSMLAERFSWLLPPLSPEEKIETLKIHSVAGFPIGNIVHGIRPYRNPHHLVSDVGLIGGGSHPRPGEISLSHNGVLFLDELPEFRRSAIEGLRQPLEQGVARITRARASIEFPARFQLLAAMNPCPCGRMGVEGQSCLCSRTGIAAYLKKLSQPIIDRIDLHIELAAVPIESLVRDQRTAVDDHLLLRESVLSARCRQNERQAKNNAMLTRQELSKLRAVSENGRKLLKKCAARASLSARAYLRVLKVAATIADLAGDEIIHECHIAEAFGFRSLERLQQYCLAA